MFIAPFEWQGLRRGGARNKGPYLRETNKLGKKTSVKVDGFLPKL